MTNKNLITVELNYPLLNELEHSFSLLDRNWDAEVILDQKEIKKLSLNFLLPKSIFSLSIQNFATSPAANPPSVYAYYKHSRHSIPVNT